MPPGLLVEFAIADLPQRVEIPELIENIHDDVINKVDETDIIGVQVIPERWPRKVQLLCAHQAAKDCLMIQGLNLCGRHIELNEPGRGVIKVVITGAPLDMPNDVLKTWVESYATVSEFRNEHVNIKGRRSSWRSGTRLAYVFSIKEAIPPAAKLPYNGGEVTVSVWHYGQTHIKCKFCHEIVPKGHECPKAPMRRCYNCGGEDHIRANCTKDRSCFKCGGTDHIARFCTRTETSNTVRNVPGNQNESENRIDGEAEETVSLTDSVVVEMDHNLNESHTETSMMSTANDNTDDTLEETAPQSPEPVVASVMEAILIGGSNCRGMKLDNDEDLTFEITSLIQGGLKINEAPEKLEESSQELKDRVEAVVVHVGTCDFPANDARTQDGNYLQYVELLNSISTTMPKAKILMSSILPRAGYGNTNINKQIKEFNKRLSKLADEEENLFFQNNDSQFEDSKGNVVKNLYRASEKAGIHINIDGQMELAKMMKNTLKEMHFRRRLEDEYLS